MGEGLIVDIGCHDVSPGDQYVISSDGLTTMLGTDEIEHVLQSAGDSPAQDLCDAAIAAGGLDNLAIIVLEVH